MKRLRFTHVVIIVLVILAAVFFLLQFLLFHDLHESGFLFFQDMMFLPIHLILVTFILDRILYAREKRERLEQMNIVIGAFFNEIGSAALKTLNAYIANLDDIRSQLNMSADWSSADFDNAVKAAGAFKLEINKQSSLDALKTELPGQKAYLLAMFNNPNLLEHDTFTNMLWALYHLIDELMARSDTRGLPSADIDHLAGDIKRAYTALLLEWIQYMKHLKSKYPYLFSLAVRKNPFADNNVVIG